MRKTLILLMLIIATVSYCRSQGVINKGASLKAAPGTLIFVNGPNGNYTNLSDGSLNGNIDLAGRLELNGNWINNSGGSGFTGPATDGTVRFTGTGTQTISGSHATAFDNIDLPAGGLHILDVNTNISCGGLSIASGDTLFMKPTLSLTASGPTFLGGQKCLVLPSTAAGTASFIDNGSITGSGTAVVERYITANIWHYFSKPITVATAAMFIGQYMKYWRENSYSWVSISSTGYSFVTTQGYALKSLVTKTYKFIGTPNTGPKSMAVTHTLQLSPASKRGWNFIGNPYPSSIDWDASSGWTKTNVAGAIYIYNQNYGNYATYSGGLGTNGGSRYIAPEQSFYVICPSGSGGTLTMTNAVRVHSNAPFMKSTAEQDYIRLEVNKPGYSDEIIVRFNAAAGTAFDADLDAYKIIDNSITQLWSMAYPDLTEQYSINSLENVQSSPDVPVAFNPTMSGTFTLNASEFENLAAQTGIYLEDLKTGVVTDLVENPAYQFTATAGDDINRFILHFAPRMTTTPENAGTNSDIQIYPNPNTGILTLSNESGTSEPASIEIYDASGKLVYSEPSVSFIHKTIVLNQLPAGIYFLKVQRADNLSILKFVIE
ncbi:MAG: T9SS type A sorting domain-containing protein [Bacteroidota bacterium]